MKLVALIIAVVFVNGQDSDEGEEQEVKVSDDYKEEKNHSEAIQQILNDFGRTLEDNKKLTEIDSPSDLSKNADEYSEDAVVHNAVLHEMIFITI